MLLLAIRTIPRAASGASTPNVVRDLASARSTAAMSARLSPPRK